MVSPILELTNINKSFGHVQANKNINLTINEIINVIKCGRPGTGMPYFLRKSYKEEKCYDTTFEDYDESYRPVSSKKFLSPYHLFFLTP